MQFLFLSSFLSPSLEHNLTAGLSSLRYGFRLSFLLLGSSDLRFRYIGFWHSVVESRSMLKSFLLYRNLAVGCRRACCSSALQTVNRQRFEWRWKRRNDRSWKGGAWGAGTALLGFSVVTTVKDLMGVKPFTVESNPVRDRVKQAWLARKHEKYEEAVVLLNEALELAVQDKEPLAISRVYDELANTLYEMGDYDEAENIFRLLIHRLLELHDKMESAPEFIEISLKLADIFARKGQLDNAETGYMHCVTKQMKAVEEHLKKYLVSHGALVEGAHPVEIHGAAYTDPIALLGMCLEQFSHFLVKYRDESRIAESEEYINEAVKISNQLYGSVSAHMINLLHNYGDLLIVKKKFDVAEKYLSLGIEKILQINECSPLIPGYFCNYAEALFHSGQIEKALEYAQKAVKLARSEGKQAQNYAQQFLRDLEADIKRQRRKKR